MNDLYCDDYDDGANRAGLRDERWWNPEGRIVRSYNELGMKTTATIERSPLPVDWRRRNMEVIDQMMKSDAKDSISYAFQSRSRLIRPKRSLWWRRNRAAIYYTGLILFICFWEVYLRR